MDKAKIYLALLIKYHFWVLSSLVLIIGLSGWGIATAALANYYKTQRAKIDAQFAKMQAITRKDNHPNKSFEEGVDKLLNAPGAGGLKTSVLRAWTLVYDEQKNQVLKWPTEMGDDFLQHVQDKGPENEIAVNYRERYQNYIKAEFPRLVKIVSAEPHSGTPVDPVDAGTEAKPKEPPVYIVNWRSANQREIDDALDWARPPTTKELLYVQENLWVYHALLDIIAKVNETATGHYNAKIKDIHTLAIARQAAQEFQTATGPGKIYLPAGQPAGGTSQSGGQQQQSSFDGRGGAGSAAMSAVQDERRYVDAKGQPLAAGAAAPPEFKRMPIYLRLMMDQREVSLLLAECANSPLPVEVHQVRINPAALRRGSKTVSPSMFGGAKRGNNAGGGGGGGADGGDQDLSAYDMPIEVFGIIYIYNRPNRAKLDVIGQAGPEAAATGQPDAGIPAAGVPAPGAPAEGVPAPGSPAAGQPAVGGPPVDNPADPKPMAPAPAAAENPAGASTVPAGGGAAPVGGGAVTTGGGTAPTAEGTPAAPAVPATPPGEPAAAPQ